MTGFITDPADAGNRESLSTRSPVNESGLPPFDATTDHEYLMLRWLAYFKYVAPACNKDTRALKSLVRKGYAKRLDRFTHVITEFGELQL